MKNFVYYLLGLVILVAVCTSCKRKIVRGKGDVQTDSRVTQPFNAIDIDMPLQANIHVVSSTESPSLQIKAQGNLLKDIKTEVKNGVLRLYTDKFFHFSTDEDIIAEISVPRLRAVAISGAGEANINGIIVGETFDLDVTGAGDVDIEGINTNKFVAKVSGAGDVTVKSGTVNQVDIRITGMGDVKAYGLQAKSATAAVTGAGDIKITALETLNASITGAGDISYRGKPTVSSSITGPGSVEPAK